MNVTAPAGQGFRKALFYGTGPFTVKETVLWQQEAFRFNSPTILISLSL
jgi:hypothetical protein